MEHPKKISPTLTLLALAISAFAIGSTEFISVGVMPLIIKEFSITLSTASFTVSAYAAGVTIGAPLLTAITGRIPRKNLLMLIMLVFIIGNLITAVALNFPMLLAGRIISALAHGLFMSVSTVIAANVVPMEKRASAIATMFTGLTVATVTGVPLGTFIGQHTGWRITFVTIIIIGAIGAIANWLLVPSELPLPAAMHRGSVLRIMKQPELLLTLALTAIGYGASFPVYTFITTILTHQGWTQSSIVIILIVYGLMVAIGNTLGGRMSNLKPLVILMEIFMALLILMILLQVGIFGKIIGLILILMLGLLAFMNVPGLQLFTMQVAEEKLPEDVQMASALNISAFNIGIVIGSYSGGLIADHLGLGWTPLAGIIMAILAILITFVLIKLHKK